MASWSMARRVAEACASSVSLQIASTSRGKRASAAFVRLPITRRSLHFFSQKLNLLSSDPSPSASPLSVSCASSESSVGFRRPEEIQWQKDLANSVSLIGRIDRSVDIKYLDTGKIVASSFIRIKRPALNKESDDSVFALQFWDELAEIAAAHLKKGDRVYIAGSVWMETYLDKNSLQRSICKVVAKDLKFVGQDYRDANDGKINTEEQPGEMSSLDDQWKDYFENPFDYWDNRVGKKNPKGPDFKHKATGVPLWIDSKRTPSWVVDRLEPPSTSSEANSQSLLKGERLRETEKLWQAFFANPTEWWDNRHLKKNPKQPDFKSKSSGEALWIDGFNNPTWVKSQVEALDSKAKAVKDGGGRVEWASGSKEKGSKTSFEDEDLSFF
eukprot:c16010_g1_i1 orf=173-1327(+)